MTPQGTWASMGRLEQAKQERSYELVRRERAKTGSFVKSTLRILFSHVGLVCLCIDTAVLGAKVFMLLELEHEEGRYASKREAGRQVEASAKYLASTFWEYHVKSVVERDNVTGQAQFEEWVEGDLYTFVSFVVNATKEFHYDGEVEGWDYSWTFSKALLFAIGIMTTIGYGHIYPVTLPGKMFTLVYSLPAIGIFLIMLANVGAALADSFIYMYSRMCCRWFRIRRLQSEIPSRTMRKALRKRLVDEDVGDEAYMPTNRMPVPITLSAGVILAYVSVGVITFVVWEEWSAVSAAYFCLMSLTTVGVGDLVPLRSIAGTGKAASPADVIRMVVSAFYCLVGLTLVSMCVSLVRERAARSAVEPRPMALDTSKEAAIRIDQGEVAGQDASGSDQVEVTSSGNPPGSQQRRPLPPTATSLTGLNNS